MVCPPTPIGMGYSIAMSMANIDRTVLCQFFKNTFNGSVADVITVDQKCYPFCFLQAIPPIFK